MPEQSVKLLTNPIADARVPTPKASNFFDQASGFKVHNMNIDKLKSRSDKPFENLACLVLV